MNVSQETWILISAIPQGLWHWVIFLSSAVSEGMLIGLLWLQTEKPQLWISMRKLIGIRTVYFPSLPWWACWASQVLTPSPSFSSKQGGSDGASWSPVGLEHLCKATYGPGINPDHPSFQWLLFSVGDTIFDKHREALWPVNNHHHYHSCCWEMLAVYSAQYCVPHVH